MKRGPKRQTGLTMSMYIDYCTGMSVQEVSSKWGYTSRNEVIRRFRSMGLPLRPRKTVCECRARNPYDVSGISFEDANRERAARAALQRRPVFEAALARTTNPRKRDLLVKRLENPVMSNADLGLLCDPPMTKDAVASLLRRATEGVFRA